MSVIRQKSVAAVSLQAKSTAVALLGCTAAAGVLLYSADPAAAPIYPPCPFRALTGLYCPGCGTLRGLHQFLHGHVLTALDLNPLMVMLLPFIGYALVSYVSYNLFGRSFPQVFVHPFWIRMLLLAVLLFWIVRNIPIFPFALLAP